MPSSEQPSKAALQAPSPGAATVFDQVGEHLGAVTLDDAPPRLESNRAQARADTEQHFRSIFDQAAVGVAQVALDGRWIDVNPQLCAIFGYSREELLATTFQAITHPDDLNTDLDHVRRVLAGEIATYAMEKRYRRKDGTFIWASLTVSLVRDAERGGKPLYFIKVVKDIDARKRAEATAAKAAAFLRAAIDALPASTAVVNKAGEIVIVNRQWREFATENGGSSCTVSEGANYLDICESATIDWADGRTMADSLRSVLEGGPDPAPLEYACHSPAQQRWFQALIHGFTHGVDRFAVITHQDVTAVRVSASLEAAHRERETVAIIAAGVAHEFNSLLLAASIYIHQHASQGSGPGGAPVAKAIEMVQQAQRLAASLLNLYTESEAGGAEPMSLYPWLPETVVRLAAALPPGIHVATEVEFDLPEAMGHALGLEQVTRNLLINAANALGDRGEIRVSAKSATVDGRPVVEIRVSDDGPGIPESQRSQVFEPGFSTMPRSHRSGLGLTIAARLLEQFGGSIAYETNSPSGSTFVVRLCAHTGEHS